MSDEEKIARGISCGHNFYTDRKQIKIKGFYFLEVLSNDCFNAASI